MTNDQNESDLTAFPGTPGRGTMPAWYPGLLDQVSERISTGGRRAMAAVNTELVLTYWHIGRDILERQDQEGWGSKVIDRLSADLRQRFPSAKGYSPRNLKYMRAFAATWREEAVVQAPLAQLPWYHHLALLDRLDSPDLRLWYASEAIEQGWSGRVLIHNIESRLHERSGKALSNFAETLPPAASDMVQQVTKDPYLFDFLSATDTRNERATEQSLIDHVASFLLELGKGFALVGRQVRLVLGGEEFFCDLLFYHLTLRRFVVIELKSVPFKPAFLGQLGMYIAATDDLLAHPDDEATIGLLLCKSKNDVVAEYALRSQAVPIGVADWATEITTSLPDELTSTLPTIEELEAELSVSEDDDVR